MFDEANEVLEGNPAKGIKGIYNELKEQLYAMFPEYHDEERNLVVPSGKFGMGTYRKQAVSLEIKSAKSFNWGSTQHLQWLFFYVLGMDPNKLKIARSGKTGLPSTGADEIDKMIFANPNVPFFRTLLKMREYEKIRDTYAKGMLQWVKAETNRIHASLKLVRTWRLSCSRPNLQNIPRLDNDNIGIRKACYARPGYMLCSTDFSQIELRVVAFYADDANMKDAYRKNQDLHSRVAKEVWKLECAVEEVKKKYKMFRYKAKAVNFGELAS
jgi:DNA polymerase-1